MRISNNELRRREHSSRGWDHSTIGCSKLKWLEISYRFPRYQHIVYLSVIFFNVFSCLFRFLSASFQLIGSGMGRLCYCASVNVGCLPLFGFSAMKQVCELDIGMVDRCVDDLQRSWNALRNWVFFNCNISPFGINYGFYVSARLQSFKSSKGGESCQ